MSRWYKVTTKCDVYTDYYVYALNDQDAREKMFNQEAMLEDEEYGYENEEVVDCMDLTDNELEAAYHNAQKPQLVSVQDGIANVCAELGSPLSQEEIDTLLTNKNGGMYNE